MENRKYNVVGWFEIYVQDIERAKKFYGKVFQVEFQDMNDSTDQSMKMAAFPMLQEEVYGAPGALVQMQGFPSGGNSTIVYFSSADCSVEEGRVESAGGKVFKSKMSIGEHGFMSLCSDPDGNMFGIHSMN